MPNSLFILTDKCSPWEDRITFTEHHLCVTYYLGALPTWTTVFPMMLLQMRKLCFSHVQFLVTVSQLISDGPRN